MAVGQALSPSARTSTSTSTLMPSIIKPPIRTLAPVCTFSRVEMLSNCPIAPENSEVLPLGSVAVAVRRWFGPIVLGVWKEKPICPFAFVVTLSSRDEKCLPFAVATRIDRIVGKKFQAISGVWGRVQPAAEVGEVSPPCLGHDFPGFSLCRSFGKPSSIQNDCQAPLGQN